MTARVFVPAAALVSLLVVSVGSPASVVIVNQDFSGPNDPLTCFYQDDAVSHDSFAYSAANGNMSGVARRGRNGWNDNPDLILATAERASIVFSCAGYGDADKYLEYTEDFDFSFDVRFTSFAAGGNDEQLMLGFWYTPEDAQAEHALIVRAWANRQHFVGVRIKENGAEVHLCLIHGNGADWSGRASSSDLTDCGPHPIGSLSTGVNYRIEGHYRWDGSTYGQLFGTLINLDTQTVIGEIAQQTITQDEPDIYAVAYNNMNIDSNNHRFTKLRVMGVGNETWGATRLTGAHFTSDNWKLAVYNPVQLTSIGVRPPMNAVCVGHKAKLSCEGYDAGGTRYDVTEWVQWASLDPAVASIDGGDLSVTGNAVGSTQIQATFGELESVPQPFHVLPPRTPHATSYGLDALLQWRDLPRLKPGTEAGMAGSYSRNVSVYNTIADCNNYDSPTGFQGSNVDPVLVRELTGPGVITRTWMPWLPGPEFKLEYYFDGETTPRINTTTLEWYGSGIPGHPAMSSPLTQTATGGGWSYAPLYFQTSLRIESNNVAGQNNFYQMNYLYLPAGTEVETYTGTGDVAYWADWNLAAEIIEAAGSNPGLAGASVVHASGTAAPAQTLVLAELGPHNQGMITRLQVKLNGPSDVQLAGAKLRVYYDGQDEAAIDVPAGEFFGAGRGRIAYKALALGTDNANGYYCCLPMPFRRGVRVELANESAETVEVLGADVEYQPQAVDASTAYLHARYHQELFAAGEDRMYTLVSVPEGQGHYVGCVLTVTPGTTDLNYLEGNEFIQVDGGAKESLYGTGMEDAFNGGYYYGSPYGGPFSGLLQKQNGFTSQYRHMLTDMVPFETCLLVQHQGVDIASWGTAYTRLYESTAYWYEKPANLPGLAINRVSGGVYHLSWTPAGACDLQFDTDPEFPSPDEVDVTGLTEYTYVTLASEGYFRLKLK